MEQKTEALYLINGDRFLHLRENGAGVGFATYDNSGGQLAAPRYHSAVWCPQAAHLG